MTQPGKSACLPTCIYNVLLDISKDSRNITSMDYKFQRIAREVEYDENLGTSSDNAVSGMMRMLSRDKVFQWSVETSERHHNPENKICGIVSSKNASYPIVSLGPDYLTDTYGLKFEGNHFTWPSHTVIVLACNEGDIIIFDPFSPIGQNSGVRSLDKYKFRNYSMSADPRNWMMWFEMKVLPMESYLAGDRR